MKKIQIWSDGSCNPHTREGGWGTVLVYQDRKRLLSGREQDTTNNRMELQAVIEGLLVLKEPCEVRVHSDNMIVVNVVNGNGRHKKNLDLVHRLQSLAERHKIRAEWVEGHAGHTLNELADRLACYYAPPVTGRD